MPLKSPKGRDVRPTADRVKESVFNILEPYIDNAKILDLFAGTGSLGIEALSRGAGNAVFIDNSSICAGIVWDNLIKSQLDENANVLLKDFISAVTYLGSIKMKFDIIFADPPYGLYPIEDILEVIHKNDIIEKDGIIIVEKNTKTGVPGYFNDIILKRTEKYGDTSICFYVREKGESI